MRDAEANIPKDGAAFDADDVPGVADGDWPGFAAQEMLEAGFLPPAVKRLGTVTSTNFNGEYLQLSKQRESEILEVLKADGFVIRRDDELVSQATDTDNSE